MSGWGWAVTFWIVFWACFFAVMIRATTRRAPMTRPTGQAGRYCRDCRWCLPGYRGWRGLFGIRSDLRLARCMHADAQRNGAAETMVSGSYSEEDAGTCTIERSHGACGRDGKNWQGWG